MGASYLRRQYFAKYACQTVRLFITRNYAVRNYSILVSLSSRPNRRVLALSKFKASQLMLLAADSVFRLRSCDSPVAYTTQSQSHVTLICT